MSSIAGSSSEVNSVTKQTKGVIEYYYRINSEQEKQEKVGVAIQRVSQLLREFETNDQVTIEAYDSSHIYYKTLTKWVKKELTVRGNNYERSESNGNLSGPTESITFTKIKTSTEKTLTKKKEAQPPQK